MRVTEHHTKRQLRAGLPTSFSQEMLIFNNQLDPNNPTHNEPFWLLIDGNLNGEQLKPSHQTSIDLLGGSSAPGKLGTYSMPVQALCFSPHVLCQYAHFLGVGCTRRH